MRRGLALFLLVGTALGASYEWGGPARRGVRALKARHYDEALEAFRAGRADHPGSAALRFDEALAHLGKGEMDSAYAQYREATALRGDRARAAAAFNLANEAMRAKRYQDATGLYRESLRIRPGDLDAKRNLEEALRLARGAQERSPAQGDGKGPSAPGGGRSPAPSPDSPGVKGETKDSAAPRGGSGEFTRPEAERWLEALEAERRGSRHQGKAQPEQETGRRDW